MMWALLALFPVFFVTLWLIIIWVMAWLSGWRTLAQTYRDLDADPLEGRRLQSVTVGRGRFPRAHYRNVLLAEFATDALRLRPQALFRSTHPPLRLPKRDLCARECSGYLRRYVELTTTAHPKVSLHLPVNHFRWPELIERETR